MTHLFFIVSCLPPAHCTLGAVSSHATSSQEAARTLGVSLQTFHECARFHGETKSIFQTRLRRLANTYKIFAPSSLSAPSHASLQMLDPPTVYVHQQVQATQRCHVCPTDGTQQSSIPQLVCGKMNTPRLVKDT